MKKMIKIESALPATFIYWVLTDFCNQKCSYCPPHLNSGMFANSKLTPSDLQIQKFLDKIKLISLNNKGRHYSVCLSGGEPTTHPMFPEIIHELNNYCKIDVITNGTRNVSYWENLPSLPHFVVITLHPEYYDRKKSRINQLSEFLFDSGVKVQYNLMCHPTMWDTVMDMYYDLDEKFRPYVSSKFVHDFSTHYQKSLVKYNPTQLEFIKNNQRPDPENINPMFAHYDDGSVEPLSAPNKLMAEGKIYFEGWMCSAGSEVISVSYDGKVRAGICGVQVLGTLEDFNILEKYIVCPKHACTCPADILSSKYKLIG